MTSPFDPEGVDSRRGTFAGKDAIRQFEQNRETYRFKVEPARTSSVTANALLQDDCAEKAEGPSSGADGFTLRVRNGKVTSIRVTSEIMPKPSKPWLSE